MNMNAMKSLGITGLVLSLPAALFEGSMLLQYQMGVANPLAGAFSSWMATPASLPLNGLILLGPVAAIALNVRPAVVGRAFWSVAATAVGLACLVVVGVYLVAENL